MVTKAIALLALLTLTFRVHAQTVFELIGPNGLDPGLPNFFVDSLAASDTGVVYVLSNNYEIVFRVTPGVGMTTLIDANGDGQGNGLISPTRVVVGVNEDVFVAGGVSDNVFRISPSGLITQVVDRTGDGQGASLNGPTELAVDPLGNLFVSGLLSENIFKVSPTGSVSLVFANTSAPFLFEPVGLFADGLGNVYAAGNQSANLLKIGATGSVTEVMSSLQMYAIDGDGHGNVYVTGSELVYRLDVDGTVEQLNQLGDPLEIRHLDVDVSGNLYVPGQFSDNVTRWRPRGTRRELIGPANLAATYDVAADNLGNVYVVDNQRVVGYKNCGPRLGAATPRNAGANPRGLTFSELPRIGFDWELSVAVQPTEFSVLVLSKNGTSIPTSFGFLLAAPPWDSQVGLDSQVIGIPDDCSLVGAPFTAQAAVVTGPGVAALVLQNAVDFTIGSH